MVTASNTLQLHPNILNKIFFGPPGTGKSFKINELTKHSDKVFRVTFHEDFSYYDFVGQYKPIVLQDFDKMISTKESRKDREPSPVISYDFVAGVFINSYISAYLNKDEDTYLIIEEINRGNCAAIFGDIFQLLDRDNLGSKYKIDPSKELKDYLNKQADALKFNIPEELSIPSNLKILATMNTSDQSLFPIDSAFKRRWQQEYCPINYKEATLKTVIIEGTSKKWLEFIESVNTKILDYLSNEDKQIGHWFVQPINNLILEEDFKYKVMSYLYYDVFKHHRPQIFKEKSFSKIIDAPIKDIVNGIMG